MDKKIIPHSLQKQAFCVWFNSNNFNKEEFNCIERVLPIHDFNFDASDMGLITYFNKDIRHIIDNLSNSGWYNKKGFMKSVITIRPSNFSSIKKKLFT